jgi:protein involved in polysaccharide export with SLBB domain
MKRISLRKAAAALCSSVVFTAAASAQADLPAGAEAQRYTQPSANYRLLPKDTVHIRVYQEDDLETSARIDVDGNILFPVLGKTHIGGETLQEATTTLTDLLHKYLVNPQVFMEISSYAKQHFTMLGQINKAGIFDIPDEGSVNLLEAIGMAGGYTKIANPSKITITRMVDGRQDVIHIDGRKLLNAKNSSTPVFMVQPGDTISVGEAIF